MAIPKLVLDLVSFDGREIPAIYEEFEGRRRLDRLLLGLQSKALAGRDYLSLLTSFLMEKHELSYRCATTLINEWIREDQAKAKDSKTAQVEWELPPLPPSDNRRQT